MVEDNVSATSMLPEYTSFGCDYALADNLDLMLPSVKLSYTLLSKLPDLDRNPVSGSETDELFDGAHMVTWLPCSLSMRKVTPRARL